MIPPEVELHPFTKERLKRESSWIVSEFEKYGVTEDNLSPSLYDFLSGSPQRFFCRNSFVETVTFLDRAYEQNQVLIEKSFEDCREQISVGLASLFEINKMSFHEMKLEMDGPDFDYFLDTELHPTLLKLVEGTFANIIYPLCVYLRLRRKKTLDKLDVFNRVEELIKAKLDCLTKLYCNTTRNAIAHRGVKYRANEVIYSDKKRTITISKRDIVKKFDDFVDVCNAISLGVILFLHKSSPKRDEGIKNTIFSLAEQDFRHIANAPGWEILRVLESETIENAKQLNIFVKNSSVDFNKVSFHSFRTGVLAEKNLSGFGRYFISIKSKNNKAGWDALNGHELKKCRLEESSGLDLYGNVREDGGFFFWQFKIPKFLLKIETLFYSFKLGIEHFWIEWHKSFPRKHHLRTFEIHRTSFFSVIKASTLILDVNELSDMDNIRNNLRAICRKIKFDVRKKLRYGSFLKYLPVGYIKINIYKGDFRERYLGVNGLPKELICTVSKRSHGKIKEIDIIGGTVEEIMGYRVVWNKAYLESIGR